MTAPIDAHKVLMTGENSFIRMSQDGGGTMSDRTSHWRVLWCPAGAGHALFMQGELTGGEVRIYSDTCRRPLAAAHHRDPAASALRGRVGAGAAGGLHPRGRPARDHGGDGRVGRGIVRMTWYDALEPFILNGPPGTAGRPIACSRPSSPTPRPSFP